MKNSNHKIHVRMVQNRKPVGKAFNRTKTVQSGVNTQNFKFGNVDKVSFSVVDSQQNQKNKVNGKFESAKTATDNVHNVIKNSSEISKKTKWQWNKQSKSPLVPVSKNSENKTDTSNTLPGTKRKFSEINSASPLQEKFKKKKKLNNAEKQNQNNNKTTDAKATVDNSVKSNKKKRKKKKKKNTPDTGYPANTQYKPVLFVKGPNDFSANWKNLKEIITKSDKEQAAKIKEAEEKWEEIKQRKSMIAKKKQGRNKIDKSMKGNKTIKAHKMQDIKHKDPKKKAVAADDIWFDNVDPILLGEEYMEEEESKSTEVVTDEAEMDKPEKEKDTGEKSEGETKAIAIDCEMVGVGIDGKESLLARISIVNQYCKLIYDKFVKPQEPVVDYRTEFSGIRPEDIKDGHDFKTVQKEVAKIMEGKILVGHAVHNDLRVLFLQHPRSRIRDTSKYKPFKTMCRGHTPKLKYLAKQILGVDIQTGEHDSTQDAQATMRIYLVHRREWDKMKKKVFDKKSKNNVKTKEMPPSA